MKGVVLTWVNLDDEAKEKLKGDKGDKGDTGVAGIDGTDGTNGANGVNGKDGVSIIFKGEFPSHPANPQNGWSYYNTTDKKSYVYQSGAWYQMTVDGVDGINGKDGLSVDYKGDLVNPPANPMKNWCYRDTNNGCVYLYNGSAWVLMVADGSDGTNGANGSNGLSVFITYNDSESQPATPTGNGTSGGWHTAPNTECVWMSQKVAADASSGSWGTPIRIKGATGPQGVPGAPGKDGKVLYTWIKYADTSTGGGISNNPTGKLYIGLAYNKETQVEGNTPSDYMWSLIKGTDGADGTDGAPGAPGADGKTTYTWIAYSDNADGSGMYQVPRDSTKYIGIAVNKDTKIEGANHTDYTWSLFKGKDGADGKPGEDANLLPWIKTWNGYATELGEEYIVTPKMFSGTMSDTGKLTGIAQGKKCITIDGVERTGIFALVDGKTVFSLDPLRKEYIFSGRTFCPFANSTDLNVSQNLSPTVISTPMTIQLPKDYEYDGTECCVVCKGAVFPGGSLTIVGNIISRGESFTAIKMNSNCMAVLKCAVGGLQTAEMGIPWFLVNSYDFRTSGTSPNRILFPAMWET